MNNIFNIPSNYNFLKSLTKFVLDKFSDNPLDITKVQIFLPSRRSCNELKKIFLEEINNKAILLPKIQAIGDIDYDSFFILEANINTLKTFDDLTKPTSRLKYKIFLIKEILKWIKKTEGYFGNIGIKQAGNLALELEKFLNEVKKNNLELDNLDNILDGDFSEHWQKILNFLQSFGRDWNKFLKENNIISVYDSRIKMIELNTEFLKKSKPKYPIIVAGCNATIKATAEFISTILNYDNCYLILKGYDLDKKNIDFINEFHPQLSFKKLLINRISDINISNLCYENCQNVSNNINIITKKIMLPAFQTFEWQDKINDLTLDNISLIECDNNFDELKIITLLLKIKYKKFKKIAVISNDENFANNLELRLKYFRLDVNNAFGRKLSRTKTSEFLFDILELVLSNFNPILLLSILKNPLISLGYKKENLENLVLLFEDEVLRKYENSNGFDSFRRNINKIENDIIKKDLLKFIDNIYNNFSPLILLINKKEDLKKVIKEHLKVSEELIETTDFLWKNNKGNEELYDFFEELEKESELYGKCNLEEYLYLLDYFISENSYSEKYSISPSINIISSAESRLIDYDLVIMPAMNEGNFPINISTDPWMNRGMRKSFGLPIKEEIISEFAYDFVQLISQKNVIITRAKKELGVPKEKSRFLLKLETFLKCQDIQIKEDNTWKKLLKEYEKIENYIKIERPKAKNRRIINKISATNIEKLLKNPYNVYARNVLKLYEKNEIGKKNQFEFGNLVHRILELFISNYKNNLLKIEDFFEECVEKTCIEFFENEKSKIIYLSKIENIKKATLENISEKNDLKNIYTETTGELKLNDFDFIITAKADRIDINNNNIATIIDYKTGAAPTESQIMNNEKLQLVIEAAILKERGFSEIDYCNIGKLEYWEINGKTDKIKINSIPSIKNEKSIDEIVANGKDFVIRLILYFLDPEHPYVATAEDMSSMIKNPYQHLSRVKEWIYN